MKRRYTALSDNQQLTVSFGRHINPPWGINGGEDGDKSYVYIQKKDGKLIGPKGIIKKQMLNKGDTVDLVTATGGGYGNPESRSLEQVKQDVKNGYISYQDAVHKYKKEI